MKSFFSNKPRLIILAVAAIIIVGILAFSRRGNGKEQILVVQPGDFIQRVSVSGKVVARQSVDLAFAETGRVNSILVAVGDKVARGQTLMRLDLGTLPADLLSAQAKSQNATTNLEKVRQEQDTLVANARRGADAA